MNSNSNSNGTLWLATIAVGLIAISALYFSSQKVTAPQTQSFGGVTNYDALQLDKGNLTIKNGNIVVANTAATSSIAVGCAQLNATSSATNVKLVFVATTTLGTAGIGYFVPVYGTCP